MSKQKRKHQHLAVHAEYTCNEDKSVSHEPNRVAHEEVGRNEGEQGRNGDKHDQNITGKTCLNGRCPDHDTTYDTDGLSDFRRHSDSGFTQDFDNQFNDHDLDYRRKRHPASGLRKDREQGGRQHFGVVGQDRYVARGQQNRDEQTKKTNDSQ